MCSLNSQPLNSFIGGALWLWLLKIYVFILHAKISLLEIKEKNELKTAICQQNVLNFVREWLPTMPLVSCYIFVKQLSGQHVICLGYCIIIITFKDQKQENPQIL